MVNKSAAIIQARMSSSRLPGKVMIDLFGKPVITHIVERLSQCKQLDNIILATSKSQEDDILEDEMKKLHIPCYRGSLDNVLERFYIAASEHRVQTITRICADSPLLDSGIIDNAVDFYFQSECDIVKTENTPLGCGAEVFSFVALQKAFENATEQFQKEHVTPYMYQFLETDIFKFMTEKSPYRLTLDTKEDLELIKQIYLRLYRGKHEFNYNDIKKLLDTNPDLASINAEIQQVQVPYGAYSCEGKSGK